MAVNTAAPAAPAAPRSRRALLSAAAGAAAGILAGVVLGASLIAPVSASGSASAPDLTGIQTRSSSCSSYGFQPLSNDTLNSFTSGRAFSLNGGNFACDPNLPNRATVTSVRFTLYDASTTRQVQGCMLRGQGVSTANAGNVRILAQTPPTGIKNAPGLTQRTDNTIDDATVDSTQWGYDLECYIDDMDQVGIYGATVTYKIAATDG